MPSKFTTERTINGRRIRYTGANQAEVDAKMAACVSLQARVLEQSRALPKSAARPVCVRVDGTQKTIGMASTPDEVDLVRQQKGFGPVRGPPAGAKPALGPTARKYDRPAGYVRVWTVCKFVLDGTSPVVQVHLDFLALWCREF
jgi:hypothetical protein